MPKTAMREIRATRPGGFLEALTPQEYSRPGSVAVPIQLLHLNADHPAAWLLVGHLPSMLPSRGLQAQDPGLSGKQFLEPGV